MMKDEEWVEIDEKATSIIRLSLGDEVIHNIPEAKTAKEVWEKLESLYMRKKFDKQVVREEVTLQFAYEGEFKSVEAS